MAVRSLLNPPFTLCFLEDKYRLFPNFNLYRISWTGRGQLNASANYANGERL